jgi:hypothetical protein
VSHKIPFVIPAKAAERPRAGIQGRGKVLNAGPGLNMSGVNFRRHDEATNVWDATLARLIHERFYSCRRLPVRARRQAISSRVAMNQAG